MVVRLSEFDDAFVKATCSIYNETPLRPNDEAAGVKTRRPSSRTTLTAVISTSAGLECRALLYVVRQLQEVNPDNSGQRLVGRPRMVTAQVYIRIQVRSAVPLILRSIF